MAMDIKKTIGNAATAKVALNVSKKMLGGGKTMLLILLGGLGTISPIIILGLGIVLILGIATLAKGGFGNNPLTASGIGSGGGALTYPTGANPTEIGNCIDNYLKKTAPKSPLIGHGLTFAQAGQQYNVNPAFLLAMGGSESTFATNWGSITADSFNYASLTCGCTQKSPCFKKPGSTNPRTWEKYQSWDDAITRHAQYIRTKYLDKNINTIAGIGAIYCGASCTSWNKDTIDHFNKITAACPSLANTTSQASAKNGNKICIDAGHNSNESRGFIGGSEGANNLEIAKKLDASLKKLGFETFMTRTGATYNGSEAKRKQDINNAGCAVSISIHSNSGGGSGTQTYICNQNYPLRWDSFPDPINSPNKSPIQYKIGNDGSKLANIIHPLVVQAFINKNDGIHLDTEANVMRYRTGSNTPDKKVSHDGDGWASSLGLVCRTNMPSILIEVGYHDNTKEAALLKDSNKQQQVVDAIAKGVKTYLGK